jgi:hypothetical protein
VVSYTHGIHLENWCAPDGPTPSVAQSYLRCHRFHLSTPPTTTANPSTRRSSKIQAEQRLQALSFQSS